MHQLVINLIGSDVAYALDYSVATIVPAEVFGYMQTNVINIIDLMCC